MTAEPAAVGPLTQAARDRLRAQARCEQDLARRVLAAEQRLAAETSRRDATLTELRDAVADALIAYVDSAGVGVDRAALILGRPKADVARLVRQRRAVRRRQAADGKQPSANERAFDGEQA